MVERVADTFELVELLEQQRTSGRPAFEFLRRESMSLSIYHLAAGEPDRQQPHTEDEIYHVLSGVGKIDIAGEATPVQPGSVIFVAKHLAHRFVDYPDGITLLVVFAPAKGTNAYLRLARDAPHPQCWGEGSMFLAQR
jgi:mannose-6-phosphate isomerase-like protein (cupin superfamily)